jgi:hypothetical protein
VLLRGTDGSVGRGYRAVCETLVRAVDVWFRTDALLPFADNLGTSSLCQAMQIYTHPHLLFTPPPFMTTTDHPWPGYVYEQSWAFLQQNKRG